MSAERGVAKKLGLNVDMKLDVECASFYILESMVNDLYPWDGHEATRRDREGRLPRDHATGGRTMMRAMAVKQAFEDKVKYLAEQLSLYCILACGGEMRYLYKQLNGDLNSWSVYPVTEHEGERISRRLLEDPCYLVYPTPRMQKRVETMHIPPHMAEYMRRLRLEIGDTETSMAGVARTVGWQLFWGIYNDTDEPAQVIADMAEMFDHPIWGMERIKARRGGPQLYAVDGDMRRIVAAQLNPDDAGSEAIDLHKQGYHLLNYDTSQLAMFNGRKPGSPGFGIGGPNWALPAALTADYLQGNIQPSTYVDRLWSVQHNGGSLFNKVFYTEELGHVLASQYNDSYPSLAGRLKAQHTDECDYILRQWIEHKYTPGESWPVTSVYLRAEEDCSNCDNEGCVDCDEIEKSGCSECIQHYNDTGIADSCGNYDGAYDYNPYCSYYEEDDEDEEEEPDTSDLPPIDHVAAPIAWTITSTASSTYAMTQAQVTQVYEDLQADQCLTHNQDAKYCKNLHKEEVTQDADDEPTRGDQSSVPA